MKGCPFATENVPSRLWLHGQSYTLYIFRIPYNYIKTIMMSVMN